MYNVMLFSVDCEMYR